jgi:ADP-heptose:LPS heptosyltransferase
LGWSRRFHRSIGREVGARLLDSTGVLARAIATPRPAVHRAGEPEKISVLAFWGIGDAILLIPLLRSLKRRYPRCELEIVGKSFLKDLFLHEPAIDTITVYAPPWAAPSRKYRFWRAEYRDLGRWIRQRRRQPDDWIVTTRGDVREHWLAALMGGRRRFGYGAAGGREILTDSFPASAPLRREVHFVDCNREVACFLGCTDCHDDPEIVITTQEGEKARGILREHAFDLEKPVVGVHVGASFQIRQWQPERFQEVLEGVQSRVAGIVVFADPQGCWKRITLPSRAKQLVVNGRLREILPVLRQVDVLLCNDSGIMHAATALDTVVVAPFGPTSPNWFRPLGSAHEVVRDESITCGPCIDRCRLGDPQCIRSVEAAWVSDALSGVLDDLDSHRS